VSTPDALSPAARSERRPLGARPAYVLGRRRASIHAANTCPRSWALPLGPDRHAKA
jgi:hypothetical protein